MCRDKRTWRWQTTLLNNQSVLICFLMDAPEDFMVLELLITFQLPKLFGDREEIHAWWLTTICRGGKGKGKR